VRHPAAIPALGLAAGAAAAVFLPSAELPLITVSAAPGFLVCAACAVVAFLRRSECLSVAGIATAFLFAGMALGLRADAAALHTPLGDLFDTRASPPQWQLFAVVEGTLRSDASLTDTGASMSIDVLAILLDGEWYRTSGGVVVGIGGVPDAVAVEQWHAGRQVRVPALLRRPADYVDPGVRSNRRELAWRGTTLVGSVKSARLVEVVASGSRLSEFFGAVRGYVRHAVAQSVAPWSARSGAVVDAILIGDRTGLSSELQQSLQEAGTYHVIAISGGNIAILAAVCAVVCRTFFLGPRTSAASIVFILVFYGLIVGGGSSVGRATLMGAIYFGCRFWDQRASPTNVAALSGVVLLCADPLEVTDAAFVLTFGATLGLLVGMPRITVGIGAPRWLSPAITLLLASLCAEIALLPVNAFVFSRVTAAGLILNFAAIPLMTLVEIAGMAAVAMVHVSAQAALWLGWLAHLGVEGLLRSANLVQLAPWAVERLAPPPLVIIAIYYGSLISILAFRGRVRRFAAAAWMCAGVVILVPPSHPPPPGILRVTFLDVGQGDAALLQFPDGRSLAVDAGGVAGSGFDIGSRVVSPTYWALGLRRLDYLSLSHGDPDHIGGAASLLRDFSPTEVWEGIPVPNHEGLRQLRLLAAHSATPWRNLRDGDQHTFGDVHLIVRHPGLPEWERQKVRNDDSVVAELTYGGVSFVFTGDAGVDVERTIATKFAHAPIRILKVPHHGSATSSSAEFIQALHPDVAVISDGRGNPFGHPVPAVVERYRRAGADIFRTDEDGAVIVETDGTTVRLSTFGSGRRLTLRTQGR